MADYEVIIRRYHYLMASLFCWGFVVGMVLGWGLAWYSATGRFP